MRLFAFCLILMMAMVMTAQAAEPSFGIKTGMSLATFTGDDTEDVDSRTGFMVGGFAEYPMSPNFSLQPEVFYTQKGAKFTELGVEFTASVNYFDIPVLGKYTFDGEKTKFFLLAGPSLGFKLSSSISAGGISVDWDQVKSTDFGLVFGAGANIEKFILEFRYNLGLTNLNDSDLDGSIKNGVWNFLVGYGF